MVWPFFCRKRGRHLSRNVSNWILSTLCIFMCHFDMMDMSDNCKRFCQLFSNINQHGQ